MKIVLGSQSSRRLEILRDVAPPDVVVEAMPTGFDEKTVRRSTSPAQLSLRLAIKKSEALRQLVSEPAILVTADTVTVFDQYELREKPENEDQARRWLRSYNGMHPLRVITSVVLFDTRDQQTHSSVDMATVFFWGFPRQTIEDIIADGTALGCAGAIMTEHRLFWRYIKDIWGDSSTVQGLTRSFVKRSLDVLLA